MNLVDSSKGRTWGSCMLKTSNLVSPSAEAGCGEPISASSPDGSAAQQFLAVLAPLRNVVEVWQAPYGSCVLTIIVDSPGWQHLSSPDVACLQQQRRPQSTTTRLQDASHEKWLTAPDQARCWICNVQTGAVLDIAKLLLQRQ